MRTHYPNSTIATKYPLLLGTAVMESDDGLRLLSSIQGSGDYSAGVGLTPS